MRPRFWGGLVARSSLLIPLLAALGCGQAGTEEKPGTIPLRSIYSTTDQEGVQTVPESKDSRQFSERLGGASNVFLVRGDDIAGAMNATRLVVTPGQSIDAPPYPQDGAKTGNVWLFVYFGKRPSNPRAFEIESVERKDNAVRLTFHKAKYLQRQTDPNWPFAATTDSRIYLAFVPLGKLKPSVYTLELYDRDEGEVTLMRRVNVTDEE